MRKISLEVNGKSISKEVSDNTLLSSLLREHLNLTGTHVGCDTSQCGACVVHVNGKSIKSCTALATDVDGSKVTTIEGLATNGKMHPMQEAFKKHHGLQCSIGHMRIRKVYWSKQQDVFHVALQQQEGFSKLDVQVCVF